jgi:hypothetical protein
MGATPLGYPQQILARRRPACPTSSDYLPGLMPFTLIKDLEPAHCRWAVRKTADDRRLLCNASVADMPLHGPARRALR